MSFNKKISVIIPAYNEELRLPIFLLELDLFFQSKSTDNYEMIIVNDGSNDDTFDVIKKLNIKNLTLLNHTHNLGKGAAIKTGVIQSTGEIIVIMDADGAYSSKLISSVSQILSNNIGLVIGQRNSYKNSLSDFQNIRSFLGRSFNFFCRMLLRIPFFDTQCGFKAGSSLILKSLFSIQTELRFGYDLELLFNAINQKVSITTLAVDARDTIGSSVKLSRASFSMIKTVIKLFIRKLVSH